MKTELQEQCTICYEILNSVEQITITKEILEDLRSLVQTIDFTLLQHKPICKACSAKIKLACKFKTTYLDFQGHFIKVNNVKDVYSDKPVYCEICKNIVNSSDTIPMFDPLSQVNKSTIINHLCAELNSRINEDPQTCESCHKSMLNFCNITNLLSVFDQDLICDENESESVTVKKELQQSDIVSTSANSSEHHSVKVKDEVIPIVQNMKVEKNSIKYDEFIAKNEQLDLKMDCEEELGDDGKWTPTGEVTGPVSVNTGTEMTTFQCDICPFKTKYKYNLKPHMRIHKNNEEIKMFHCNMCDYKAKEKSYVNRHMRVHKKPDEIHMYQCKICDYRTRQKGSLNTHMIQHKKPDEVEMFQCNLCEFTTKFIYSLKAHNIRIHKNPEEIEMFHCIMCKYTAKEKRYIGQHMRIHKKPDEMFQCELCEYKTSYKNFLKRHILRHQKPDKVEMFQCDTCEYTTINKYYLKTHMLKHKKPDEIEMIKCEICEYKTINKYNLKTHMLVHKGPEDVEVFQCETCEYKTKRKSDLKKHTLVHKRPEDVEMFQCEICEYKTIHKCSLKKHTNIHKK